MDLMPSQSLTVFTWFWWQKVGKKKAKSWQKVSESSKSWQKVGKKGVTYLCHVYTA
jgi:hypothetical protein